MTDMFSDDFAAVLSGVRELAASRTTSTVAAQAPSWDAGLWELLQDKGFALIGIPEASGGMGGPAELAVHVTRVLVETRTSVPYPDAVGLGAWLAARAGFPVGKGTSLPLIDAHQWGDLERPQEKGFAVRSSGGGWVLDARIDHVPWARTARHFLIVDHDAGLVARVAADDCAITCESNLADEPLDRVVVESAPVEVREVDGPLISDALVFRGALFRASALAGAMDQVLRLTLRYVQDRNQFGGPLARLGAVQQLLAELAAEVVVSDAAVAAATQDVSQSETRGIPLALVSAKARTSRAASRVAAIAHQLHGAIGMTREYPLEYWSRRLLAWRDDYGTEQHWERWLGRRAASLPTDDLWAGIVTGGSAWDDSRTDSAIV